MCSEPTSGHEDLWIVSLPADRGPEGNLEMWREAEEYLDYLSGKHEGNETRPSWWPSPTPTTAA